MKNFSLNADFKREVNRGLCPVLKAYPDLKIRSVKGKGKGTPKKKEAEGQEPSAETTMADHELAHITGIRVKGNPFKKEPFQKDAWAAISNKYLQATKVDVTKIFGKDSAFKDASKKDKNAANQ